MEIAKISLSERLTMMFQSADLPYSQADIEAALKQYDVDVENGRAKSD